MNRLEKIFVANAAVLCTHQIDAAYWHEWELFHLPGGNQFNLLLNLPLLATVFLAFWHVSTHSRLRRVAHTYLAGLGFLTTVLHGIFFALGNPAFMQWTSIGLIVATAVLSSLQLRLLRAEHHAEA